MNINQLYKVRNMLNEESGALLVGYLSDYITDMAFKNIEATELKGMCKLLEVIKRVPDEVEKLSKR